VGRKRQRGGDDLERRTFPVAELRVAGEEGQPRIIGHAAVFDSPSEPLGFGGEFREIVRRGAFSKTLQEADIRALLNHDPNYVLGRNRSGTLTLTEDDRGLAVDVQPPDTTWARDLLESIRRGDINQMSFGFRVVKDRWETEDGGEQIRELLEVELFDVSVVTYPAYPQTAVAVRALEEAGIDYDRLSAIIMRAHRGLPLTASDRDELEATIRLLQGYLPPEPPQAGHSERSVLELELEIAKRAI